MKLQLLHPRTGVRSRPLSSAPALGSVPPANNAINNAAFKTCVQSLKKIIRFLYHMQRYENKIVEDLVRDGERWLFYYGGADKYVGVASAAVH